MKKWVATFLLILLIPATQLPAQNNLPYLGRPQPGMTALRFPPDSLLGNSSWWWHGSPAFAPGGLEMFWTEYVRYSPTNEQMELFTMSVENNNWGPFHHPVFGNPGVMENNPVLSPGGDTLYFFSGRTGGPYFRTTRTSTGWSVPVPLLVPIPAGSSNGLQFAVNRNGDLYIEVSIPPTAPPDLYFSKCVAGNYQMAQKLGPEINSDYLDAFPFVDPDEEYLIFASNRPGGFGGQFDMYISFKNPDGTWSSAMNMGGRVNSSGAWFASVTPDKKFLFFNTWRPGDQGYNAYWISTAVIDSLKLLVGIEMPLQQRNHLVLHPCTPNPVSGPASVSFETDFPVKISVDIADIYGRRVMSLTDNLACLEGKHTVMFDASKLREGLYLLVLKPDTGSKLLQRLIVIK